MGKIKSALELALERTDSIKSDKTSIGSYNAKQRGLKLANDFLGDTPPDLAEELKKASDETRDGLKAGILEGLLGRIALPYQPEAIAILEKIGIGLAAVVSAPRFSTVYKQFMHQMSIFPEEYKQYDKAIRQQYAPRLRQKEEMLSQQLGYPVKLDPMQDPDFAQAYNQNMTGLKSNYEDLIAQLKAIARGEESV
jgi:uncharacterized protein YukE